MWRIGFTSILKKDNTTLAITAIQMFETVNPGKILASMKKPNELTNTRFQ